mmetsp:Transcript_127688/g.408761  ORF Transcript_127688/g.408761 Transcript_127688/m.408761 type:complete len:82 (-) Transcript_127688:2143-2388(-)
MGICEQIGSRGTSIQRPTHNWARALGFERFVTFCKGLPARYSGFVIGDASSCELAVPMPGCIIAQGSSFGSHSEKCSMFAI